MPPSKSGIADYSAALATELKTRVELRVFEGPSSHFNPSDYDLLIYQIGNNPYHAFAYEMALLYPGIIVMHEASLHHLLADITIRRGDWDGYIAECEYNGGAKAREFAMKVRALEEGPDYDGLPMTRRLLEKSRGVIVHSEFVASEIRAQGFTGPIATIPHGASLPQTDRNGARHLLGVDSATPLIGAFGYLKPYKRIGESLRALKRLVAADPRVRMVLVGEPHPEFPIHQIIRTLGLTEHVRVIGFVPIEKFVDYMGACDIILNLRYPTVGETSGSLQRALGLGKAVIVSDLGSFAELPDDVCLKVPAGPGLEIQEEDLIFEYLNLLTTRPDLAAAMGARAKRWIEEECSWSVAADHYAAFAEEVVTGKAPVAPVRATPRFVAHIPAEEVPDWIDTWVAPEARPYAAKHVSRFVHTFEMIPVGDESKSILEMGAYMQITPSLRTKLGYGYVRGCYYGPLGRTDHKSVVSESGEVFECDVDHFDAEKDIYPYPDASFDTVLCCELLEHLPGDPMHMMFEINRILKPGGHLVLTTPNICSMRAISAILQGYHPAFFPAYIRPRKEGEEAEARHNREYAPMEIQFLLNDGGFEVVRLETGEFLDEIHPEFAWVEHLLETYRLHTTLRGDGVYVLGRKTSGPKQRWPHWLYQ